MFPCFKHRNKSRVGHDLQTSSPAFLLWAYLLLVVITSCATDVTAKKGLYAYSSLPLVTQYTSGLPKKLFSSSRLHLTSASANNYHEKSKGMLSHTYKNMKLKNTIKKNKVKISNSRNWKFMLSAFFNSLFDPSYSQTSAISSSHVGAKHQSYRLRYF
jgi:hypothetical protein